MDTNMCTVGQIAVEVTGRQYKIIGGPSVDRVWDAAKYCRSEDDKINIKFHIAAAYTSRDPDTADVILLPVDDFIIEGVHQEDGSGFCLMIDGICKANLDTTNMAFEKYPCRFVAFYNARNRIGWFVAEKIQ